MRNEKERSKGQDEEIRGSGDQETRISGDKELGRK
jgi:hypothetical protein